MIAALFERDHTILQAILRMHATPPLAQLVEKTVGDLAEQQPSDRAPDTDEADLQSAPRRADTAPRPAARESSHGLRVAR